MTELEAKRQLRQMLRILSPGSILHLLGEAYRRNSEAAGLGNDPVAQGKCDVMDHVLFCLGVGIDAALPQ